MTYAAAKHPYAPHLWIVTVAATGQRAMCHHHWKTKGAAQEMADHLNAIAAPAA